MLWALIKKDLLHLIRVKRELSTLLVMPAVLIAILGYALGGVMNPEPKPLNVQVAVIREGNVKKELEQFKKDLARFPFSPEERLWMAKKAEHFVPSDILVRDVLRGEKGKKAFTVREISPGDGIPSAGTTVLRASSPSRRILTWPVAFPFPPREKRRLPEIGTE